MDTADGERGGELALDSLPIAYDPDAQAGLAEHGLATLREHGKLVVRGCEVPAVYNAALHFVMSHDLRYDYDRDSGTVTITPPPVY